MTEDEFINKIKKLQEPDESFIYFWMHPELNLKYIGSHHGNPDDGYTGSGIDFKEQLKKNPIEEWDRIILAYTSGDQQYEIEESFLKFFNVANDPNFLNRIDIAGGFGVGENHRSYTHGILVGRPKDHEARKKWFNELPPEHQEKYTEWFRERQREYQRGWYKNNREFKLKQVKEWREKNKEKYLEQQRKYNKEYRERNKEKLARKRKEAREKKKMEENMKNPKNTLEKFL
tara:strand:+ start:571 stop:1263 length:693 start_codon:yes stop_codon:yes gene_type:complete